MTVPVLIGGNVPVCVEFETIEEARGASLELVPDEPLDNKEEMRLGIEVVKRPDSYALIESVLRRSSEVGIEPLVRALTGGVATEVDI